MGKRVQHESDPNALARSIVVVHGWYGHGNLGDEALLHALCRLIYDIAPEVRVFATAGDVAGLERAHPGVTAIPTRTSFGPCLTRTVSGHARAVLVGGGNLLQEYATSRSTVAGLARRLSEAAVDGARVALLGVGVGDVSPEGVDALRELAKRAEGLIVRERASLERADDWGLPWHLERACDLALLEAARPVPTTVRSPRVLVNLKGAIQRSHEDDARVEAQAEAMARTLGRLADQGLSLVGVPFRRTDEDDCDYSALLRVAVREPRLELLPAPPTPAAFLRLARTSTHALTSRLHSAILTAGAGCAVACVPYADKCRDFFTDLGLEDQLTDERPEGNTLDVALAAAERNLEIAGAQIARVRKESLPRYRAMLTRCLR